MIEEKCTFLLCYKILYGYCTVIVLCVEYNGKRVYMRFVYSVGVHPERTGGPANARLHEALRHKHRKLD